MSCKGMSARIVAMFLAAAVIWMGIQLTSAQQVEESNPSVPFALAVGLELFQDNCASCHGEWGKGTDTGPPLMHGYYVRSHHGDVAFYRAIEFGSPQHHWAFGDMPPVEGLNRESAEQIVSFVRWLQAENWFE